MDVDRLVRERVLTGVEKSGTVGQPVEVEQPYVVGERHDRLATRARRLAHAVELHLAPVGVVALVEVDELVRGRRRRSPVGRARRTENLRVEELTLRWACGRFGRDFHEKAGGRAEVADARS